MFSFQHFAIASFNQNPKSDIVDRRIIANTINNGIRFNQHIYDIFMIVQGSKIQVIGFVKYFF